MINTIPDLQTLRWKNRVLLVFAPDENDHSLAVQKEIVDSHVQGFSERDIKAFRIVGNAPEIEQLRNKVHAESRPFTVVLIGKDGGVKLRKHEPLSAEDLFKTIDQMPMRRQEMKERE